MKLIFTMLILAACCGSALAQSTIETAPLKKLEGSSAPDPKRALLVTVFPAASYQCPEEYDLYVERQRPKDSKEPDTAFKGLFWISPPVKDDPNSGLVTSRAGNEVTGFCLKVK